MLPEFSYPSETNRQSRDLSQSQLLRLQAQRQQQRHDLDSQVQRHLIDQKHFSKTAELIERIIIRYPDCPRAQSMWVDQLLAGDESLANALREEI